MLSRRQGMQIAFSLNNPALTARLMKDYRNQQAVVLAKVEKKGSVNPIVNFQDTDSFIVWGAKTLKRSDVFLRWLSSLYC